MDIFIFCIIIFLLILGVAGSVVPVLPGPLLSYVGLLLYHFFINPFNLDYIFFIGIVVIFISVLDYYLQIYGVQKAGGGKYAIRCSLIGMLLGMFLIPPFGILLGAFIGAFIGAKIEKDKNAVNIAFGAVWGFVLGAILKLGVSVYIIYFLLFS